MYPKPNKRGWEEKYRYAKAYENVSEDIINFFMQLDMQYEVLSKRENEEETDIETA